MKAQLIAKNSFESHKGALAPLGIYSSIDISKMTFSDFRDVSRDNLSWSDARHLYIQAKRYTDSLNAYKRKVLTHANPQLKNALHLAHKTMAHEAHDYETLFGQRADTYVPASSVASMFSPAAYLTELYREGRQLHYSGKTQHLDTRRPDLRSLALNQSNQDVELSTLTLSNEILLANAGQQTNQDNQQLLEDLAYSAYPFDLPYHAPFSNIETVLAAQDTRVEMLADALLPIAGDTTTHEDMRASFVNHLSPRLSELLMATIPPDEDEGALNDALLKHFGTNDIEKLSDADFFCQRTGITRDELNAFLALPLFMESLGIQDDSYIKVPSLTPLCEFGGRYLNRTNKIWIGYKSNTIFRVSVDAPDSVSTRLDILPSVEDSCIIFAARAMKASDTYVSIKIDGKFITSNLPDSGPDNISVPFYDVGYRTFSFPITKNAYTLSLGLGDENIYNPGEWFPSLNPSSPNFYVTYEPVYAADLLKLSQLIRYHKKTGISPATLDTLILLSQGTINTRTLELSARVLEYQLRYGVDEADALVLAGADICAYAPAGELSQFDRLFNNPPLNGIPFTIDDANDTISFNPTDTAYVHERAVLKRALGVDDEGLMVLANILTNTDNAWARSLTNISMLYRVGLLARVHGLSPQELQRLLQLNGKTQDLIQNGSGDFTDYLDAIFKTHQWLAAQDLTVAELDVMTTKNYSRIVTPDMDNFIRPLYPLMKDDAILGTFEVASIVCPSVMAGQQLIADIMLTRVIRDSDVGQKRDLSIRVLQGSASPADYLATNMYADALDIDGNVLHVYTISAQDTWGQIVNLPTGTIAVRLYITTVADADTLEEQLTIGSARRGNGAGEKGVVVAIYPYSSTQTMGGLDKESVAARQTTPSLALSARTSADPLYVFFAPYISATFQLSNIESAISLQIWIEQVAAEQGLALTSMAAFRDAIVYYYEGEPTEDESANIATFCHALAQITLIIKRYQLSSADLSLIVTHPQALQTTLGKLSLTLDTIKGLGDFKTLQRRVGNSHVNELLTLLNNDSLNASALAKWLNYPESEVTLAAYYSSSASNSLRVETATHLLAWLDWSVKLGVSVKTIRDILSSSLSQSFNQWQHIAGNIQASVTEPAASAMNNRLDEMFSAALCSYYLVQVAPYLSSDIPMLNRDDIFSYLLIDNQVSGDIKTTRIAEAISSIQFYINRCMQGVEDSVDKNQLAEAFFSQWEQYNKRYSTWAAVSQLAYYPENYIDPTLRYNQSDLQQQLLDELNQSQLNKDSVEAAYLNYLTRFEDVADLTVKCGYHHATDMSKGVSYFIGRSNSTPYRYYWRSLNHEASDGIGGYAASAWTNWEEISGSINPINDEVRPVMFNNRLYIAWISKQVTTNGVDDKGEPIQEIQYTLQISYRMINGGWGPAINFPLSNIPDLLFTDGAAHTQPKFNIYLSFNPLQDAILFMLYDPARVPGWYDGNGSEGPMYGGIIDKRMQYAAIEGNDWISVYAFFSKNLNSTTEPNKIIRYINAISYGAAATPASPSVNKVDTNWLVINAARIDNISVDNLATPQTLTYRAYASIKTIDRSVAATPIIEEQGVHDYGSAKYFDVTSSTMSSNVLSRSITYTQSLTVKTKLSSYDFDGVRGGVFADFNMGTYPESLKYEFGSAWEGEACVPMVRVSIQSAIANLPVKVYNYGSGKLIYEGQATVDGIITFEEINPEPEGIYKDGTLFTYRLVHASEANRVVVLQMGFNKATPVAEACVISFNPDVRVIPRGPAGTHSLTLQHVIPTEESDSAINYIRNVWITVQGQPVWERVYTLGQTAYIPARTFTYNWGDGDVSIPVKGTITSTAVKNYDYQIPINGLSHVRTLTVKQNGAVVYKQDFQIVVSKNESATINPADNTLIIDGDNHASYLEASNNPKRTRLNTLFAPELVKRAQTGLDNVLSWETQQLSEPAPGPGFYVNVVLAPYDSSIHGTEKWFKLNYASFYEQNDYYTCYEGMLSDTEQVTARIFCPYPTGGWSGGNDLFVECEYQSGRNTAKSMAFSYTPATQQAVNTRLAPGVLSCEPDNANPTEPMDFSSANGLYFWELFYYTPMLAAERLLQSQHFEDAERWLNYVFNPAGYVEGIYPNRQHVDRQWNTRPLAEDMAWDETQTDSTDPDVVAQADPMHYKVTTFMKLLDLLIARGDMAYRQLERDTLTEAKMWYLTAQQLLGPQPDLPLQGSWSEPSLSVAAQNTTTQQALQLTERLMLGDIRSLDEDGIVVSEPSGNDAGKLDVDVHLAARTANTLTALFLPTENDKLSGYWHTLAQRLFNLRHNLSIDGQPLTLPLYSASANPKALQNAAAAAAASAAGASNQPNTTISIMRFPLILESARALVNQLVQYGTTLSSVLERRDAAALEVMLQTHAQTLYGYGIQQIEQNLLSLDEEHAVVEVEIEQQEATRQRMAEYYDQNISPAEKSAISLQTVSAAVQYAQVGFETASAALKSMPNIFGFAVGGSDYSAFTDLGWRVMALQGQAGMITADVITTTEAWRRRREEWKAERDAAERQIRAGQARLRNLDIQKQAQLLQKAELEQQQSNTQTHYDFLKTKFSTEALYSWMQGRLSALYYQFYDLSITRCLKAQLGYQWETRDTATFIQPGDWDSNHAGLLCGETLLLSLARMESAYLEWDARALEVSRTVSMAQEMGLDSATFNAEVNKVLGGQVSTQKPHTLTYGNGIFVAQIDLGALAIANDYPNGMVGGKTYRFIKQVSVSLPALLGPYQDIQAVLKYSAGDSSSGIHQSCTQAAISHGLNDSGQFQLDFNDGKYLPFEGLPIGGASDGTSLTLSFPNAGGAGKQKAILETLNDIVLHIRYTIRD